MGIAESACGVVLEPDDASSHSYDNAVRTGFVAGMLVNLLIYLVFA
jgi:hypothetical protein